MTGSACQIGASAKADAFIIIHNQIILLNPFTGETCIFPGPFSPKKRKIDICYRYIARLFVSIAHAHAQKRLRAHAHVVHKSHARLLTMSLYR